MLPAIFAAAGATAGALAALVIARGRQRLDAAERLAAATLETLLNAIDANDALTGAHVRRVAAYAITLADAADLDSHGCSSVERVALFHDVGKIHAALFDIIHDPTGLSDEERKAVRTHPARGAEVLEPLTAFYPDLAAGVLAHHERWDGTGYPRALRGEQIPMAARIVAIADTFDAVSASRRYHRGAGVEKAARVIADGRGTQFDPALTDLFLRDDVFARVKRLARTADRKRKPAHRSDRRRQSLERSTPSVTFRWRDELQSG